VGLSAEEPPEMVCEDNQASVAVPMPLLASGPTSSKRHSFAYLTFTLCAVLYLLPFMRLVFKGGDEGSLIDGAIRILHGQVFARDFFEVIGPGTFYLLAGFFKLFGATFLVDRTWLLVTSLGTFLSMYFLSRRVCGRYQILPPLLLVSVYFSTLWPMVNHHVDSNFFLLLAVVCLVFWQDSRKSGLLLAAGVLAGVTTCILQPKGMLLLLAFLVWLWTQQTRRTGFLTSICMVVGGYCSIIGLTFLYFWSRGALWDLIYVNFIWPSQHYGAVNAVSYATGMAQFWNHWVVPIHGIRWFIPVAVVLILPVLLVAALPALVPVLAIPQGKKNLRPEILLYWLSGWALWLSEIHRRDIAHLTSGSPLLLILCVYFLAEYQGKIAGWAIQLLAVGAGALAVVNLFIVLCVHSVPTRVGSVGMFKPDPVIAFVDSHVAVGTEIFVYPTSPMLYFLTGTINPTRYSLLVYNYNTPSQFQDAIRILQQHKTKYVLWDTTFATKAALYFSLAVERPSGGLLMEPYLESHYRLVQDFHGTRIMERKVDNNGDQR